MLLLPSWSAAQGVATDPSFVADAQGLKIPFEMVCHDEKLIVTANPRFVIGGWIKGELWWKTWGAFDSAKNHKRQSVTAKSEKSQTQKFVLVRLGQRLS